VTDRLGDQLAFCESLNAVDEDRFFCRRSGIPPNLATSGLLPSPRSALA